MLGKALTATATATPRIATAVSFARRIVPVATGSGSRIAASRASIASASHCEAATSSVTAAASNYPMALDEVNHRLFVGCRQPAKLLVYDTTAGTLITSIDIVGDTDDLFYDAATKRLYVLGGEGFITVLQQQSADRYPQIQKLPTAAGARTGLFVPELGKLFLAVPHRGGQGAEIRVYDIGS